MNKKQKRMLIRIIVTTAIFIPLFVIEHMALLEPLGIYSIFLFLPPYFIVGYDVIARAGGNIARGRVFDENFLMTLATFGAFATGEYPEAVAVMLFYQVGELFQSYAVNKSRASISELMDICPEYANLETPEGYHQVDPDEVRVGDIIVVLPGERVPLDGVITFGQTMLDTSALTGESVPRSASEGDEVISGCVNGGNMIKVKVQKPYADSTVAKILELVENASDKKAKVENFITRFARYYTPIVVIAAAALAIIPPLFTGEWEIWPIRACTFLVISCPCALVISVPLSFFSGIGAASKNGILVKGSNFLEVLAEADTVIFDKTGTLTKGVFEVTGIYPNGVSEEELLSRAACAESFSSHPIAKSILSAYGKKVDGDLVKNAEEISGHGVKVDAGCELLAGNARLMKKFGVEFEEGNEIGTVVYVAADRKYIGRLVISDMLKPDSKQAISSLKNSGLKTVMLTGDRKSIAQRIAGELSIDEVESELLPEDKVRELEKRMGDETKVCYVGDGINDAPVIARADVGIAMGSMGSDAAIEAADIVIMDDKPSKLSSAVRIAKKTRVIVRENIIFALAVKALVLILGAIGIATMWEAVFADVGVAVIAILNAMRALRAK